MTKRFSHPPDDENVAAGNLINDLRAIMRDAEDLLRATEGQAGDRMQELRARAEESLQGARDRLSALGEDAEQRVRAAAQTTDSYVRDNPWKAVAIAVGVGFLIGTLGRRR